MVKFRGRGFWSTVEKLEKLFVRVILLGFICLGIVQIVLVPAFAPIDYTARTLIYDDSFEGERQALESLEQVQEALKTGEFSGTISLSLENFSSLHRAKVLVNGKEVGNFREKEVTIGVNNGDEITIDGSFYKRAISIKVVNYSSNIKKPDLNKEILIRSDKYSLGQVKLEE